MITAALSEELKTAAATAHAPVLLLKTGIGPRRAARRLEAALRRSRPDRILTIGYAGALAPGLAVGDLVVVRRALLCLEDGGGCPLPEVNLDGSWDLKGVDALAAIAQCAGLRHAVGDTLTSPYVFGEPAQKRLLHSRFGASLVDMETAALARAAANAGIPFGCVRVVSDSLEDDFLAPFSYDPRAGVAGRFVRAAGAGKWTARYSGWRERSAAARAQLERYMRAYAACLGA